MTLCWPILMVCLIRSANSDKNGSIPLIFNGHYISWPSNKTQEKFIQEKRFIPQNIIYTRFQICSNRIFLAAPRYRRGVPFTLGYVIHTNKEKYYHYVKPFPCMESRGMETGKGTGSAPCDSGSLVNVIDLVMGQDGILWVLDIGLSDTLSGYPYKNSEPKIIAFDVNSGKIKYNISLHKYTFSQSRLQNLVVEYVTKTKTILYISDGGMRSIIVLYVQNNDGYRIKLPQSVMCGNKPLQDVLYMVMIEQQAGTYVYFTYLFSDDIFRIKTKDMLKTMHPKSIVNMGKKPNKMVFLGVGNGTVLFFRIKGQHNMYSWDTKQCFLEENFMVVWKSKDCRVITHVDIDKDGVVWILESNIQDFILEHAGRFGPSMMLMPIKEMPVPIKRELDKDEDCSL